MLYSLARPLLFSLAPERAHELTLSLLKSSHAMGMMRQNIASKPVTCMGIEFPNPVGLAAGLDKNGAYIDALASQGFGFIEIGTITPRPQAGNPQPRLFRLPKAQAIINRMGFNNLGVDHLASQISDLTYSGIIGVNIGKNKDTPLEKAVDDYLFSFQKVYRLANYITINLSSPNTPDLRQLQFGEYLAILLTRLKQEQRRLTDLYCRYVPLVVKIAPDMTDEALKTIAAQFLHHEVDGVIACNTTV